MSKKVYFIEAKSPGSHVFSAYPIPRLGTVVLATILRGMGYDTRVFIEDVAKPDWKALYEADVIGISTITSTAPRAFKLADDFRAKGKTVIMGGPHVTFLPEEALAHADYVVRGEGEDAIVELMEALEGRRSLGDVDGLSYKAPSGFVHNPGRKFIADLDAYPVPDFSLVHSWSEKPIVPIATSRGCPFDCRFCSVIQMFGRKYRFKSHDRVMEEVRAVAGTKSAVFFIDDNFTANKARTKELLRSIIAEGLKLEWNAQVRSDAAEDPELLSLMKESGCTNVFVGFESINPKTLELFNKRQKLEDITRAIRSFREHGLRIHGMFVFGSDTDEVATIRETERFARKAGVNSVQFLMLTPLPGTPVYAEMSEQGRLLHTDWSRYDAHHAVFQPKLMTPTELQRETFKAMAKFYSWRMIIKHLSRLDLYYSVLFLYGKRSVKQGAQEGERYLRELKNGLKRPALGMKG